MYIDIKKTYKGRTAGGYLKSAEVSEMQSGDFFVTSPDLPGCIILMSDNGDMIVSDFGGVVCSLRMSQKAYEKLNGLETAAANMFLDKHPECR